MEEALPQVIGCGQIRMTSRLDQNISIQPLDTVDRSVQRESAGEGNRAAKRGLQTELKGQDAAERRA